jgi:hypothetical protein
VFDAFSGSLKALEREFLTLVSSPCELKMVASILVDAAENVVNTRETGTLAADAIAALTASRLSWVK